ncbi:MAG: peptide/nickel transport system ATP-binding protein [Flavobacteriaceae bacterium]|jgi:peptide/nickel transport system ATP-binding protein
MSTKNGNVLLEMRNIHIEGFSDEQWHPIIKGVDLTLRRGEVLGLIGESGAGKSTLGLAAMGFARPGCKFTQGTIKFDGVELTGLPENEIRKLWGTRIASLIKRLKHRQVLVRNLIASAERTLLRCTNRCSYPTLRT